MPQPRPPERLLRRLEWTVLRRLDGLLQGDHRGLYRGSGLDLAELREYRHGDDVRRIDWNVTARLQTPHVREYHEERDLTAWFLLDLSPSVDFGSAGLTKRDVSAEVVAVLARLLGRAGNRVGAMFYGERVDVMVPAAAGRRHVLRLLEQMLSRPELPRARATDLAELADTAGRVIKRRSLVFVVSDFISAPGWPDALRRLAARHEVVAIRLCDPLESALPDLGLVAIEDAESGEQMLIDTHDAGFCERFARGAARREAELRDAFADAGVDALELVTGDDVADALWRFSLLRKRLGARA